MNDIIKAMVERRSIRKFKQEMPAKSDIDQIIEAGLYAASANAVQIARQTHYAMRMYAAHVGCRQHIRYHASVSGGNPARAAYRRHLVLELSDLPSLHVLTSFQ